jgi:Rieske Fe-S protein
MIFVYRSPAGVRALSARCTHLGCAVLTRDDGFLCPCHGSRFDAEGKVLAGAAQRDLPWLRVSRSADGGLLVHMSERVSPETVLAT